MPAVGRARRAAIARTRRPLRDLLGERAIEGISCAFCHQVHGPVGRRAGAAGTRATRRGCRSCTGATFAARPEDGRGLLRHRATAATSCDPELLPRRGRARRRGGGRRRIGRAPAAARRRARATSRSSEFCGSCHDVRLFGTDALGAAEGRALQAAAQRLLASGPTGREREERAGRAPRRAARTAT